MNPLDNITKLNRNVNHLARKTGDVLIAKSHHMSTLLKKKLWLQVILALILGALVGLYLGPDAGLVDAGVAATITGWLALPGNIFLQLVKMIIIPLIFSSIILGIISSGSPEFLRKIGPRMLLFFVLTTVIAIFIGLGITHLVQPGMYMQTHAGSMGDMDVEPFDMAGNIPEKVAQMLPSNPLQAMVSGDMLSIIIFTIIAGIALLFVHRKQSDAIINMLKGVQEISMIVVKWAMLLVPYAVFGLMTQVTSQIGLEALSALGVYMLCVIAGLLCMIVLYMIIVLVFARRNPFTFIAKSKEAMLLAFSTSSSAAAMPLSMKIAEQDLHVRSAISQFIIPVGATINMAGTALYQAVATLFLAQAFGVNLSLSSIILIVVITVGASIGTPSVPGVGIVILATILEAVGIPGAGILMLLGVDRILDMSRTVVNVTGDLTACVYFDRNLSHLFHKK